MNVLEIVSRFKDGKLAQSEAVEAIKRLVAAERERCAKVAESEEELDGPMPDENWVLSQRVRLEDHLRATVRTTKANIARRIRMDAEVIG